MKGDSLNLVEEEKEQLLNIVVEYFASIGQSLRTVNLEDNQDKEGLLIVDVEEEDNEDCAEYLGKFSSEMVSLYHELSHLEDRLENRR